MNDLESAGTELGVWGIVTVVDQSVAGAEFGGECECERVSESDLAAA